MIACGRCSRTRACSRARRRAVERLEPTGPDEFDATLSVGVAAVKGTYQGKLAIVDKTPPEGYTLRVEGSGRPGFVKGEGRLTLTEEDGGTLADHQGGGPGRGTHRRRRPASRRGRRAAC